MREYVPNLIDRKKRNQATPSLRIGNRVLIMDENTRRGQWLTGTVTKLFPGDDGRIRSVSVKTATSELTKLLLKYPQCKLFHVAIKIGDIATHALVDTGASVSAISEFFFLDYL